MLPSCSGEFRALCKGAAAPGCFSYNLQRNADERQVALRDNLQNSCFTLQVIAKCFERKKLKEDWLPFLQTSTAFCFARKTL